MEVKRSDEKAVPIRLRALMVRAANPSPAAGAGGGAGAGGKAGQLTGKALRRKQAEEARAKKIKAAEAVLANSKAGGVTGDVPRRGRAARTAFPQPQEGKRNVLITSALPYVNNVPHLGNIIGCVLSGDVYARFCRQRGTNVAYVCGTDEYGTATEAKAREEGLTPRAVCDKYHAVHAEVYKWFDIDFDHFGRTSCAEPRKTPDWPQTVITQDIFKKAKANGHVLEKVVKQQYCETCDTFLADRFIEGTCPLCGYEDARGDQCDGCGKLIDATELIKPRCKVDAAHVVSIRSSEHLFLDLPRLSEPLKAWLDSASKQWSQNAVTATMAWFQLEGGLQPRCITRDLKWGTPVPVAKHENKVFYVWFDAPIGYISITANATESWKDWWQNPDNVELYQFMGKDNVPFHTIIFPSSLIATGENWTLLNHLSTTEYLNYEGTKFSKSRSTGVFGMDAKESGIPSEVWRYYLLSARPENADTDFVWTDFGERNNTELLKNLGNFVNRVIALTNKYYAGVIPAVGTLTAEEEQLRADINERLTKYNGELESCQLRNGLRTAMDISSVGNGYLQRTQPWKTIKTDKARVETIIAAALSTTKLIAAVMEPFMPGFSEKVYHQLNLDGPPIPDVFAFDAPAGHKINAAVPIFRFIPQEELETFRRRFSGAGAGAGAGASAAEESKKGGKKAQGKQQQGGKKQQKKQKNKGKKGKGPTQARPASVARIDMRVGVIKRVWHHPDADTLFCEEIDIGEGEPRQVASGLRAHYSLEQMEGRKIVVICNLKPRKMRGFVSHGMVLCANGPDGKVEFADPPAGSQPGDRITCEGYEGEPDESVNPTKKNNAWTGVADDLFVENGVATYKGVPLVTSAGPCKPATITSGSLS